MDFVTSWKNSEWSGSANLPEGLAECMVLLTGCKVSAQGFLRPLAKEPLARDLGGHSKGPGE